MLSSFSLSDFQGVVLGGRGLAKTNRFEITINPPRQLAQYGPIVSILAEQANMPMLSIGVKPFKIHNAPAYQRPVNVEYGGEGIAFTFHVDGQMIVKRFFDEWMQLVVNKSSFGVNYQEEYATTIYVAQLNEMDQIVYEVELTEAFPRNFNPMPLDNSAQAQTQRLTVMFSYRKWIDVQHFQYIERGIPIPVQQPQSYNVDNRI